jgi:hypothetical protein
LSGGRLGERMKLRWDTYCKMTVVLIILGLILVAAAIAGGIAVSKLLWLLLIAALVVFAVGVFTGRITE